jgi:hypothetical protein
MAGRATAPERATVRTLVGQKRDMTGIELRIGRRGHEKFRAYVADPERPGRKVASPWGTYEQAVEWRGKALGIKAEAKRVARERRAQDALDRLERSSLNLSRG